MNASAATRLIQPVGSAAPRPYADAHRDQVDDAVAIVMPMRTGHDPVAGGEGQRHELGLVAQLGDEDDAEGEQRAVQDGVHGRRASLVRPGFEAREPRPDRLTVWSKVSPAPPERGRAAGRRPENRSSSVCRPRHWGLLPFAARQITRGHPAGAAVRERDRRLTGPPGRPRSGDERTAAGEPDRRRPHQHQERRRGVAASQTGRPTSDERDQVGTDDDGAPDRPRSTTAVP